MLNIVEFPKLGLVFKINPEAFHIGELTVYWYGILMASAFLVSILWALRDSERFGIRQDDLIDMLLITTPLAIIGARLFYVVFHWDYYGQNPSEIYKTWHGGIAIYGAIIVGIIVIMVFCRIKKLNALKVMDFISVYVILGQVIGRWGNFINQELFGTNTDLPWGMTGNVIKNTIEQEMPGMDPNKLVHPVFLYEIIWNLLAFIILMWYRKRKKSHGEVLSLYMVSYGIGRAWIESLRTDKFLLGNVKINLVLGIIFAIVFIAAFFYLRKRSSLGNEPETAGSSVYSSIVTEMQENEEDDGGVSEDAAEPQILNENGDVPDKENSKEQ